MSGAMSALALSGEGLLAAEAGYDGRIRIYDWTAGELAGALHHGAPVNAVAFSATDEMFASAGDDGAAVVWVSATGARVRSLQHSCPLNDVAFGPGDELVATAGADGSAVLWRLVDGECLAVLRHEEHDSGTYLDHCSGGRVDYRGQIRVVSFSADGTLLSTVGDGATVLWDVATGDELLRLV
jgi:WD40 repeat protein